MNFGVRNVVWFNWSTYAASVAVVLGLGLAAKVETVLFNAGFDEVGALISDAT